MGTATRAAVGAALVVALVAARAHAEPCTGGTGTGGRFATCFDLGNRLSITAGSDGFGGSITVRHVIHFDDEPDLVWRMQHVVLDATHAGVEDRFTGLLYRGRFIRHARDGHIVLPLGTPKRVFLPFDIGALAEVGAVSWRPGAAARIGVVKTALLVDFARTRGFGRRLAFGPVARWDVELDRDRRAVTEHVVAPFTTAAADLHFETDNGITTGDLRVEAGSVWRSTTGWTKDALAEATLERIVLAVNDRPIALVVGMRYESATGEAIARVGARIVLFDRADPRVSLHPLGSN